MQYRYSDLIRIFEDCFYQQYRTRLVAGEDEPYYQPSRKENGDHKIVFAHGFFASALHEVAHWCIAGNERRQQFDYGYWYEPDGRNAQQQLAFEQVERKPQAIEWLFSLCVGKPFEVSVDNLGGVDVDRHAFQEAVYAQLQTYLEYGLPKRAAMFAEALATFYQQQMPTAAGMNSELSKEKELT